MKRVTDAGENEELVGFALLKDATKDELIEEILTYNRRTLEKCTDIRELYAMVIGNRVNDYRNRLAEEAGMVATSLGFMAKDGDETDE